MGRRFVVACDNCGATLDAGSSEELDAARRSAGWTSPTQRPDLCADCAATRADGTGLRRFQRT